MRLLCTLIGVLLVVAVSVSALAAGEAQQAAALQQSFVWAPSAPTGKQVYAVFRKTLALKGPPQSAVLRLFADSRYILWINGKYVDRGPCRFDPKGPEYDALDVTAVPATRGQRAGNCRSSLSRRETASKRRGDVRPDHAPRAGTDGGARYHDL